MQELNIISLFLLVCLTFATFNPNNLYAAQVNINTAPAHEIAAALYGIGSKKAQAIVEYRTANGPFKTPEDLMKISGIGPKTVASIRHNLRFETKDSSAKPKANQ